MILKFREWDIHGQKMFTNDELIIWNGNVYANDSKKLSCNYLKGWTIDDKYRMQSTGLCDKEGQEIFEGDILTDEGSELEDGWVYVSVISKDGMYYCQENNPHGISGPLIDFIQCYSVVGNIYENPELLENKGE